MDSTGIRIGPKSRKPMIEVATNILWVVLIFFLLWLWLVSLDIWFRQQDENVLAAKYSFLCPYIHVWVEKVESDDCRTTKKIWEMVQADTEVLQKEILTELAEYIPIKVSKNLIDGSPEKAFIEKTYAWKLDYQKIISRFEEIITKQSEGYRDKILCDGLQMTELWDLSTQCIVYGGEVWSDGENGRLGSSRLETLKFIDALGRTEMYGFILKNPPSELTAEEIQSGAESTSDVPDEWSVLSKDFKTRTAISINLQDIWLITLQ